MNTKIKIMLNDSETITNLAKDPEVEKEIKKAILDGISKRVAKAIEGEVAAAIKEAVSSFTHPKKANEVFDKPGFWGNATLSDKMIDYVNSLVEMKVRREIEEVVERFDANAKYVEAFNRRKNEIEQYDFDMAVQEFIRKNLAKSFGKLMEK